MASNDFINIIQQFQTPIDPHAKEPQFEDTSPGVPTKVQSSPTTVQPTDIQAPGSTILSTRTLPTKSNEEQLRKEYHHAIGLASRIPKNVLLETFNPYHMKCAAALTNTFVKMKHEDLLKGIQYAKTQVGNSQLLNYAFSVALRHRHDAIKANIQIPSHVCTTPQMYIDMAKVKEHIENHKHAAKNSKFIDNTAKQPKERMTVEITSDLTATDMDPEHRVAYFREDIGVNLHHRHWHEVYPYMGSMEIVNKDRRGELFYYMHQQVLARYNFERLSNSLPRAKPYNDFRASIVEAYFPKLDSEASVKLWCPRQANAFLRDLDRDGFLCTVTNLERWRERIYETIDRGYAYVSDEQGNETLKRLVEPEAINDLGNTLEAVPELSWNSSYYGELHNKGHLFFSYCHDPDKRFKEQGSVMSHSETALRDPIFYSWHAFVDDIFQHYKATLPPYHINELKFPDIQIKTVEVKLQDLSDSNMLKTFWQTDEVNISEGILNLNAETDGSVFVKFTHLQHKDFFYEIMVNNAKSTAVNGTVRIFIAPKCDESGQPTTFNKQRKLFIELDKFTTKIEPGKHLITRKSTDSSVTIPFEQSFMTTNEAVKYTTNNNFKDALSYCGCGWPQHLLIGKGTTGGFPCQLFVMITDYETDKVQDSSINPTECCTKTSVSYCGLRDKKYPDKKPMGFPFDRNMTDLNATLDDFLTESQQHPDTDKANVTALQNMKVIEVTVQFRGGKPVDGPTVNRQG